MRVRVHDHRVLSILLALPLSRQETRVIRREGRGQTRLTDSSAREAALGTAARKPGGGQRRPWGTPASARRSRCSRTERTQALAPSCTPPRPIVAPGDGDDAPDPLLLPPAPEARSEVWGHTPRTARFGGRPWRGIGYRG